ncbi:MAG: Holliday junction branch migration protein RuvA [candidate division KSB1 bacterium]|nr:Holliday junction branch migration protein RuvA [candidate division KSB1 bacterium]MDZ7276165.1 Holliday junction branch migration protein RuvA [candidate division KSB1 bacterium]MDZ7287055.1 Holliday junction branch migration protein RuvA [candidate division KSB1 bacterium]MDZ7297020.1 Holliday junction branch migration protein RuvA [candidate division KSB1 bacterium]MDZ7307526.1 Holliday junction branch migration protein RuvA [candidate division KSB1 bacterium]
MIAQLHGRLLSKSPARLLLEVNGVGYDIAIPLSTYEKLGPVGESITVFTHLLVREDALQLFGFATLEEKQLFLHLLTVNGVGPKVAQSILSGCTVETFCRYIQQNEIGALTAIPGIGKKTAERLVVELRDRLAGFAVTGETTATPAVSAQANEALLALVSLGYPRPAAEKAIRRAVEANGSAGVEELLKAALRHI